jgi:hypothetical protein
MADEEPKGTEDLSPDIAEIDLGDIAGGGPDDCSLIKNPSGGDCHYCNAASCMPDFAASMPPLD